MQDSLGRRSFGWNSGGWFGAQLGSTLWLAVLGIRLLPEDVAAAAVALGGFVVANLWGLFLWRRRSHVAAYSGLQWLMTGLCAVFAPVVLTIDARIPTIYLPYWAIAAPLLLMAVFWLQHTAKMRDSARE